MVNKQFGFGNGLVTILRNSPKNSQMINITNNIWLAVVHLHNNRGQRDLYGEWSKNKWANNCKCKISNKSNCLSPDSVQKLAV